MSERGRLDLALVQPGSRMEVYQRLGSTLTAIEPPVWAGLMATFARARGYSVEIVDAEAEDLAPAEVAERLATLAPRLATVVVFGHQPSASTQTMPAAGAICTALRARAPGIPTLLVGGHVSALPERTLREEACDFVCQGEGPHTIVGLLEALRAGGNGYDQVPGLWYREGEAIHSTPPAPLLDNLDRDLPQMAWDLLPVPKYRAHNWHCFGFLDRRRPYASIYTSLGCPYRCSFCCINSPFGKPGYRYRSAESVIAEIDLLVQKHGVRNIKILDEMFVLNYRHVESVCDRIIERGHDLNIWAYARVDTVKESILDRLRRAGISWLALGIESGSQHVRDGAQKTFGRADIAATVRAIQAAGINVIGNYIFGLPDDDHETMQATLDLACELQCEFANFYSAMAYPGSRLYDMALAEGWPLPGTWSGYSQHAVDTLPLPTRFLSAAEVLRFRDRAFEIYFTRPEYLQMVERKFGPETAAHVREMASHRLDRRHA
ncbi:MAG: cobalamin B12-binding domain-containing protein [Candidatus Rokubacteria bacterium]|nr:cobalamin B12-binding domain-containing protein [Candidatus Rokubacteria bacterium]